LYRSQPSRCGLSNDKCGTLYSHLTSLRKMTDRHPLISSFLVSALESPYHSSVSSSALARLTHLQTPAPHRCRPICDLTLRKRRFVELLVRSSPSVSFIFLFSFASPHPILHTSRKSVIVILVMSNTPTHALASVVNRDALDGKSRVGDTPRAGRQSSMDTQSPSESP